MNMEIVNFVLLLAAVIGIFAGMIAIIAFLVGLKKDNYKLKDEITELKIKMDKLDFDLNKKIDKLDFDLNKKIDKLDFDLNKKIDKLDNKFDLLDERYNKLENNTEVKFENANNKIDKIDNRIDKIEIDVKETKIENQKITDRFIDYLKVGGSKVAGILDK